MVLSKVSVMKFIVKWVIIGSCIGLLSGSASAFFLGSLDWATRTRIDQPWLLYLLPLGGVLVSYIYSVYGSSAGRGNNLILEQINEGKETIPLRMAPLVLFGTITTHLFGGSAGREGTAVQMGGSLAEWVGQKLKLSATHRRMILMCGISSGFGAVFGTPLAGMMFGIEVSSIGKIRYGALFPCFVASVIGDYVTTAWGIHHLHYSIGNVPILTLWLLGKIIIASILFGLTSLFFSELTHRLKKLFSYYIHNPMLKSMVGGLIIIGLVYALHSRDYLGLGLPLLAQSFEGEVHSLAFFFKTIFTSITLGAGFQGGEVTPLFVIGATLGNTLSDVLHVSAPFLAGLGLIAVFSGATNTPLACFIMGIELFGSDAAIYMLITCFISYLFSGHSGIYTSQQWDHSRRLWFPLPIGNSLKRIYNKYK